MTVSDHVYTISLFIIFITVVVGGTFIVQVANLWIKNKREERESYERGLALRATDCMDKERAEWMKALRAKDDRIEVLSCEVVRLTKQVEINRQVIEKAGALNANG